MNNKVLFITSFMVAGIASVVTTIVAKDKKAMRDAQALYQMRQLEEFKKYGNIVMFDSLLNIRKEEP